MNPWINIEVAPDDKEILALNQFELQLGNIPKQVYKVRELKHALKCVILSTAGIMNAS